jgi:hypothetical protein
VIFVTYLLLSSAIVSRRGDVFLSALGNDPALPWYVQLYMRSIGITFPEFHDYLRIVDYYPYRWGGITMMLAFLTLLPQEIWSILGVDKLHYLSFASSRLMADFLSANSPIRIGIFGEFYINFDITGMIWGLSLFGFLLSILAYAYMTTPASAGRLVLLNFFTAVLTYTVVAQFDMIGSLISSVGYPLFASYLICRQTRR